MPNAAHAQEKNRRNSACASVHRGGACCNLVELYNAGQKNAPIHDCTHNEESYSGRPAQGNHAKSADFSPAPSGFLDFLAAQCRNCNFKHVCKAYADGHLHNIEHDEWGDAHRERRKRLHSGSLFMNCTQPHAYEHRSKITAKEASRMVAATSLPALSSATTEAPQGPCPRRSPSEIRPSVP